LHCGHRNIKSIGIGTKGILENIYEIRHILREGKKRKKELEIAYFRQ
jgi:hypothetical protein